MRILLIVLSFANGLFMLADGIYVIVNGKYIGPEKPGPWAMAFDRLGVNVYRLGPIFIAFGIVWLAFASGLLSGSSWAYNFGIVISILTLWYLPFGTLLSIIVLAIVVLNRSGS